MTRFAPVRLSLHAVAEEPPTHPEPASSSQSSHRFTSTEVLLARHQPSMIGKFCSRRPLSVQLFSLTPATSSQSLQSPAPTAHDVKQTAVENHLKQACPAKEALTKSSSE